MKNVISLLIVAISVVFLAGCAVPNHTSQRGNYTPSRQVSMADVQASQMEAALARNGLQVAHYRGAEIRNDFDQQRLNEYAAGSPARVSREYARTANEYSRVGQNVARVAQDVARTIRIFKNLR